MVTPAWPPMTGTFTCAGSTSKISPTNALARATSSLVTPNSLAGLKMPALYIRQPFGVSCFTLSVSTRHVRYAPSSTKLLPTYFLKTSAAIGTVELTGLDMIATQALGQYFATPSLNVLTIPAATAKLDAYSSPWLDCSLLISQQQHKMTLWEKAAHKQRNMLDVLACIDVE